MQLSRRAFLKRGSLTALLAGTVSNSVSVAAGQRNAKDNPGANGVEPNKLAYERLARYTRSTFAAQLNSNFRLTSEFGIIGLKLIQVQDSAPPGIAASAEFGHENFILVFRGNAPALPQDTYMVEHESLGTFPLFLVPATPDASGQQGFVAVVNRVTEAPAKPRGRQK
jgi:uncharacterized protein DUF6916